jgi:predicted RNase H-like HicB family nuclease
MKGVSKMAMVYPVIFTKTDNGYVVHVPDMDIDTQGRDLAEAIYMARDAIGITGIDMQDEGRELPSPSNMASISSEDGEFVSIVDIDFDAYRRANEQREVIGVPRAVREEDSAAIENPSALLPSSAIAR